MITTNGGGALITPDEESWCEIMMYATQYRESLSAKRLPPIQENIT